MTPWDRVCASDILPFQNAGRVGFTLLPEEGQFHGVSTLQIGLSCEWSTEGALIVAIRRGPSVHGGIGIINIPLASPGAEGGDKMGDHIQIDFDEIGMVVESDLGGPLTIECVDTGKPFMAHSYLYINADGQTYDTSRAPPGYWLESCLGNGVPATRLGVPGQKHKTRAALAVIRNGRKVHPDHYGIAQGFGIYRSPGLPDPKESPVWGWYATRSDWARTFFAGRVLRESEIGGPLTLNMDVPDKWGQGSFAVCGVTE